MSWQPWMETPLRVVVIIAAGFVLNGVIRLVVHRVVDRIATGTPRNIFGKKASRRLAQSSGTSWMLPDPAVQARRSQRARTVGSVLRSIASIGIVVIVILMLMTEFGFNLGPVLASAGIVGVALGFGAQTLVKDFLSGLFIVAEDQYGIGDVVDLGDVAGTVEAVGLRVTQIRSVNGTLWHVRNGEILRVGNQSQGWARAVLDVPVPYDTDVPQATELMLATAKRLREDPAYSEDILDEPEVWGVEALTGESIVIRLVVKTKPLRQWEIARVLRARLKTELDRAGLQIPLLQQTMIRSADEPYHAPAEPAPGPAAPGGTAGESADDDGNDSTGEGRDINTGPGPKGRATP